jgi:crotonobetainyl-CoA:carnitine CoA-transferase CaiB-like acyl-CoA transferase
VAAWIAAHASSEVLDALDGARIPITLVNDLATLWDDPHVRARHSVVAVEDDDIGDVLMPAPFPRLTRSPGHIGWTGRRPGADTDAVCVEWLELTEEEISALRTRGAVS